MKKILITIFMMLLMVNIAFADVSIATRSNAGTVPTKGFGNFMWSLEQFGESVQLAFTFNKENKKALALKHLKERVDEMLVLEDTQPEQVLKVSAKVDKLVRISEIDDDELAKLNVISVLTRVRDKLKDKGNEQASLSVSRNLERAEARAKTHRSK